MSEARPEPSEPELDADARAMLDAFAAEERIPSEVHDRVWERVAADVGRTAAPKWPRRALVISGLVAAAAVVLMWTGARALRSVDRRERANQAEYGQQGTERGGTAVPRGARPEGARAHDASPNADLAPERAPETTTSEAPSAEPEAPTTPHAEPEATTRSSSGPARRDPTASRIEPASADATPDASANAEPPATAKDTLLDELEVIRRAATELDAEHQERALAILDEHARRFPSGVLTEERQFLRARALCEAGREVEGKAQARIFLRTYPRTAFAERLRSACPE